MVIHKYSMVCTCGDVITTEANSMDNAIKKIQSIMNADGVKQHMTDRHPGELIPPVEQVHMMIAQKLQAGEITPEKQESEVMNM